MSSQLVAAIPCSVWSSRVASMIRRRVCATADALRVISYLRGDICLTNILRVIILADVVLPKLPNPAPQGGTDGKPGVDRPAVPHSPWPAALVLRHARRGQGVRRRHRRPVHPPRDHCAPEPAEPAARALS